jgi:hypothetical protein
MSGERQDNHPRFVMNRKQIENACDWPFGITHMGDAEREKD